MDTSEIYIKMCDCPEIQGNWTYGLRDWVLFSHVAYNQDRDESPIHVVSHIDMEVGSYFKANYPKGAYFWLPRQDQIQEMIPKCTCLHPLEKLQCILARLIAFSEEEDDGYSCKFISMEQLWLAFYMQRKHYKRWNGKKWNKEMINE